MGWIWHRVGFDFLKCWLLEEFLCGFKAVKKSKFEFGQVTKAHEFQDAGDVFIVDELSIMNNFQILEILLYLTLNLIAI